VNGSNPLLRLAAGIVAVAIALRVAVELISPVMGFLIGAVAIVGVVLMVRWWRNNRW
jgi:hypothetical protein